MGKNKYNKQALDEVETEDQNLAASTPVEQEEKVDFDGWFVMREASIPKHHRKEIIKADFKGRGLKQHESITAFDAALKKYGIKLD